ncbi:hypothetical protein LTR84_005775 [Exophiala bonariae]|uniref:Cyclohexanone monooxygenase n=1 Tax=Exophiala bonariae TaxID=1690606 RepID=A0AAV9N4I5_9EURO|nr:hypothetical protein LTR84_005775 [Exophiala bonariae]
MVNINVDALVVGAGFAGIYQTYRLRELGFNVRCIDKAGGVGGTWYWNRYPGAMSDTETYLYRYSWDKEDLCSYPWTHTYVYQPQILEYLNHVVDKHNLRKNMQFHTEMTSADWDEESRLWTITCATGDKFVARYLINALGLLSTPNYPNIKGIDSFQGTLVHTASWPEDLDLNNKTVGVIGNGSTGVQVLTALAPKVKRLVSFQRHPQYSVPSGQGPVQKGYRQWVNENYDQIYQGVWNSSTGFGVPEVSTPTMSVSAEERERTFQALWDQGNGFRFMFSGFGDITTNETANIEACKFIRSKIDEIVKDPKKAAVLKPKDLYARRPLCDTGYYQIFNQENVDIVGLQDTPITSIVPEGIETADGKVHKLDVLIFATGFDAIEGSYLRVAIKGRNHRTLKEEWKDGASAFAAVAVPGFPNMFLISGPQGPFANFPCSIESEVNFITACIQHAENQGTNGINGTVRKSPIMVAKPEANKAYQDLCFKLTEGSLFTKSASWIFGTNLEGRKPVVKFYFGGLKAYRDLTGEEEKQGFPSFSCQH